MTKVLVILNLLALAVLVQSCAEPVSDLRVVELTCQSLIDPIGIDASVPSLSWKLESIERARKQTGYQILVASRGELLAENKGDLWDSGRILSDETTHISYRGLELKSNDQCFWKVRVWDQDSLVSEWSEVGRWSMGLLRAEDWQAQWIGFDEAWADSTFEVVPWGNDIKRKTEFRPLPCPHFRKVFVADHKRLKSAVIHIAALGVYELYVNGKRISNDYFTPGWTDYRERIYYNSYDVNGLILPGENVISVILGDGWYAGAMARTGQYFYGDRLRVRAQLHMRHTDGTSNDVVSDGTWKAAYGSIRYSDMQNGETYDARLEQENWGKSNFNDDSWSKVLVMDSVTALLEAYPSQTVQKMEELKPASIVEYKPGVYIVDMGQNFAGWAKLKVQGQSGDSVVMRFGEILNPDGSLHTRNLRTAGAKDVYVLKGDGEEIWEPRFTYHGFQFIEITGFPGVLTTDNITGIVLHSNLPPTGNFECSNDLINRLQQNIVWSQRSNYFEVPTDCPQRDERMGWTGDAQVFMRTGAYNMDIAAFFNKWIVDVVDGQKKDGNLPSMAPRIYKRVAAGWGDAGIICPWTAFQFYNDTAMLAKFYPAMQRWMNYHVANSQDFISTMDSFGDWQNVESETPIPVIATAYFKHSADIMAQIAHVLGDFKGAEQYAALSNQVFLAFNASFVTDSARVDGNTQTAYLMALAFDLLPENKRRLANDHLIESIDWAGGHLTTGILGTHLLLPVLSKSGKLDLAYDLLLKTDFPSWGFQIENGANTIWERWDSYDVEKGLHEDSTNSLNHYAYGAVGEWFYSTIAGIESDGPGFKQIIIRPQMGGGLTYARADYASILGKITSNWALKDGAFHLEMVIPANTSATVYLPSSDTASITESGQKLDQVAGVEFLREEAGVVVLRVLSGSYHFQSIIE